MIAENVMLSELPVQVTIPCVETAKSFLDQKPTKYVVEIDAFGLKNTEPMLFEEFEKFHGELTQFIRGLPSQVRMKLNYAIPPLPQTYWIGNEMAATIETRRAQLEEFLQKALLQPDIVNDKEERLWRFLKIHPAGSASARLFVTRSCGPWLHTLWERSFQGEGVLTLRHPAVEDALLQIVKDAVNQDGEFVDAVKQSDVNTACGLLEKVFVSVQDRQRSEKVLRSSVESLLNLVRCQSSSNQLRDTASSALLQLVREEQNSWQQVLFTILDGGGVDCLAAVAEVSRDDAGDKSPVDGDTADLGTGPTTRLVAELLLRGFDGRVVTRFIEPDLAASIKRLLNALFLSVDLFVRLTVGLLLGRLVCESGYAETVKAESGLRAICSELPPKFSELAGTGIGQLLAEDQAWERLCRLLASPEPTVSGYALILLEKAVKPAPSRILNSVGVQDSLLSLSAPESEPFLRNLAARLLLRAYGSDIAATPSDVNVMRMLEDALHQNTETTLVADEERHTVLGGGVTSVRDQHGIVEAVTTVLTSMQEGLAKVSTSAEVWTSAVELIDTTTRTAEVGEAASLESLRDNRSDRDQVIEKLTSLQSNEVEADAAGHPHMELHQSKTELAAREKEIEERNKQLEKMVQKQMELKKAISETNEVVKHWEKAAEELELKDSGSEGSGPSAQASSTHSVLSVVQLRPAECRQRQAEAEERIKVLHEEESQLEKQLQQTSEPLPTLREEAERLDKRVKELMATTAVIRQKHGGILNDWNRVLAARDACTQELQAVSECLDKAGGTLSGERKQRRVLRNSIQELVQSLVELDGQLEALGPADGDEE